MFAQTLQVAGKVQVGGRVQITLGTNCVMRMDLLALDGTFLGEHSLTGQSMVFQLLMRAVLAAAARWLRPRQWPPHGMLRSIFMFAQTLQVTGKVQVGGRAWITLRTTCAIRMDLLALDGTCLGERSLTGQSMVFQLLMRAVLVAAACQLRPPHCKRGFVLQFQGLHS